MHSLSHVICLSCVAQVLGEMNVRCCDIVEGLDKMSGVSNPSSEISPHAYIPDHYFLKVLCSSMLLVHLVP